MKVRFSPRARRELGGIGDWIAQDDPARAARFVAALRRTALATGDAPRGFPLVPRYSKLGIRRRVHGNYLIFYRVEPSHVVILRVLHGARDYDSLLDIAPDGD